jgi:uncharacterized protein (TIGR00369 family)
LFFNRAPLKASFGMTISYNDQSEAVFEMPYNASFDHTMGGIYGGVIASMIDNAGWFTAAAQTENWVSTANLSIQILEPAERTLIRSVGHLVRSGKSLIVVNVEVRTERGNLIAIGTGMFSVSSIRRAEIQ